MIPSARNFNNSGAPGNSGVVGCGCTQVMVHGHRVVLNTLGWVGRDVMEGGVHSFLSQWTNTHNRSCKEVFLSLSEQRLETAFSLVFGQF